MMTGTLRKNPSGPPGEERNIALWVILSLVTCGLAQIVWVHAIGSDLNRHAGDERVHPVLDIVLAFLTCGLWAIYIGYRYPRVYVDIAEAEGIRADHDLPVISMVLSLVGLGIVSWGLTQHALNEHWRRHQNPAG